MSWIAFITNLYETIIEWYFPLWTHLCTYFFAIQFVRALGQHLDDTGWIAERDETEASAREKKKYWTIVANYYATCWLNSIKTFRIRIRVFIIGLFVSILSKYILAAE